MAETTVKSAVVLQTWEEAFRSHLSLRQSENTVESYLSDVRVFANWFSEANDGLEFDPGQLTSWDVREYRKSLIASQAAPATINRKLASLRALAAWALGVGMLSVDPTADISGVGNQQLAPRSLRRSEFAKLMRVAERQVNAASTECARVRALRDRAIVALLAYGMLRVSEVANLFTGDVSLSERRGSVTVRDGKGDKWRIVPLASEARAALGDYLRATGIDLAVPHRPLWQSKHGEGITPRTIQRTVEELARLAGIEDQVTPHRLRHTGLKRLVVDKRTPLPVAAAIAGHSRIETTRRYTMPSYEDMEAAVEEL